MTCNQLMVLLGGYRGSIVTDNPPATYNYDCRVLKHMGLIKDWSVTDVELTDLGRDHVQRLLSTEVRPNVSEY